MQPRTMPCSGEKCGKCRQRPGNAASRPPPNTVTASTIRVRTFSDGSPTAPGGEQEAIISRELWDRVKAIREGTAPHPDRARRQETIAPLKNILRCGHCGGAMMPTYTTKGGRRYYYYYYYACCKGSKRAVSECPVRQIQAGDIEEMVKSQTRKMLGDISLVRRFAEKSGMDPMEVVDSFREDFWNEITPGEYNRLLTLLIEKAVVWDDRLEIEFKTAGIRSLMEDFGNG